MGLEFKKTISLDTVIATLALLGALLGVYVNLNDRLARLETRVEPFWQQVLRGRQP